ncbi:MAG TPA: FAD:protein FMN transferase [Rhizomicrobium sp.]|nr:FAD:protein FMN transferase [Rhizomicrobium sp.]
MPSSSHIERSRPLLGTFVTIGVRAADAASGHAAIDAAFAEIARVHALMSFHEAASDVSRANREAHVRPVSIDQCTHRVIGRALEVSAHSYGAFDITVAPTLVARGHLPRPQGAPEPAAGVNWRHIELLPGHVFFRKPLWIDLGGIAKGFAIDAAMHTLAAHAVTDAWVDAGGDIAVAGESRRIALNAPVDDAVPVMDLANGCMASSCGSMVSAHISLAAPHVRTTGSTLPEQFVSVVAPSCIDADALTKVVMALGAKSAPVLAAFDARAVVYAAAQGWQQIGTA